MLESADVLADALHDGLRAFPIIRRDAFGEATSVDRDGLSLFRGVPAEVAGLELHSVVVETSIPAEQAEAIAFYRGRLHEGITAGDREAAEAIVESIREDVGRFEQPTP